MDKPRIDALRRQMYGWLREKFFDTFGVPAPKHEMQSRAWVDSQPAGGEWIEVSPARHESIAPRPIEGATDEIQPHLGSLSDQKLEEYHNEIFGERYHQFDPQYVVRIERGRVTGRTVAVMTDDGTNLTDLGSLRFATSGPHSRWNHRGGLPRPVRVPGNLAVMSYATCGLNFFHFLIECLPKLRLFEESGIPIDRFYVPYGARYAQQLLSLFGVGSDRVIPEANGTHLQADQLVACSPILFPRREDREFLFDRMAAQPWSRVGSSRRRRIYISRAKAGWRKVVNERELMQTLRRHGFQRYFLEDLSSQEQIQLFQEAEVIIGPHGAGLANVVFTPPGATVIELGTVYRPFGYFHRLCSQCDHKLVWFVGKAVRGTKKEESHLRVDVRQLDASLQRHLAFDSQLASAS